MSISRVKTWIAEVLTASDLNAEFDNIINNALSLISPLTGTLDANGNEIVLDADGDSSITADTDDRIDLKLSGVDLFRMDGTATTPVNGISFVASATLGPVQAIAFGTDANIDLHLRSKGSGNVVLTDDSGNEILIAADVASAVNEITVTNAVTTASPSLSATGDDTNISITLTPKGTGVVQLGGNLDPNGNSITDGAGLELLSFVETGSAVNEITVTNAATGSAPIIAATGDDTNVSLNLTTKGTGRLQANSANIAVWEEIGTASASSDATIEFTWAGTTYKEVRLIGNGIFPATDDVEAYIRTSTDGGSTFDSTVANYAWNIFARTIATDDSTGNGADTQIQITASTATDGVGNVADTEGYKSIEISIFFPALATHTSIQFQGSYRSSTGVLYSVNGSGVRTATADVDGVQFRFEAGNISSGEFACYGLV